MSNGAAGFWSYVQKDDEGDNGRILALKDDLRNEYRIQTGDNLELFVDRDSIEWGEAWERRIDDAIAGTTFFIPIITPSYFRSNACRQELLKFVREAERLGLSQLLMSVYWVVVSDLDSAEDSKDEAIRHVGKYQWLDLRQERFEERDSSVYRRAVANLAAEIAKRAAGAEAVDDLPSGAGSRDLVPSANGDVDDEPGIVDQMVAGEEAMGRITTILEEIRGGIEEVGTRTEKVGNEFDPNKGMKAMLTASNRLAGELDEPATLIEDCGRDYAKALSELDPGIHIWLDVVDADDDLDEPQREALQSIVEMVAASEEALMALQGLTEEAKSMANLSRSLRAPVRKLVNGVQGVLDGKTVLVEWGRRAESILATHGS